MMWRWLISLFVRTTFEYSPAYRLYWNLSNGQPHSNADIADVLYLKSLEAVLLWGRVIRRRSRVLKSINRILTHVSDISAKTSPTCCFEAARVFESGSPSRKSKTVAKRSSSR